MDRYQGVSTLFKPDEHLCPDIIAIATFDGPILAVFYQRLHTPAKELLNDLLRDENLVLIGFDVAGMVLGGLNLPFLDNYISLESLMERMVKSKELTIRNPFLPTNDIRAYMAIMFGKVNTPVPKRFEGNRFLELLRQDGILASDSQDFQEGVIDKWHHRNVTAAQHCWIYSEMQTAR